MLYRDSDLLASIFIEFARASLSSSSSRLYFVVCRFSCASMHMGSAPSSGIDSGHGHGCAGTAEVTFSNESRVKQITINVEKNKKKHL